MSHLIQFLLLVLLSNLNLCRSKKEENVIIIGGGSQGMGDGGPIIIDGEKGHGKDGPTIIIAGGAGGKGGYGQGGHGQGGYGGYGEGGGGYGESYEMPSYAPMSMSMGQMSYGNRNGGRRGSGGGGMMAPGNYRQMNMPVIDMATLQKALNPRRKKKKPKRKTTKKTMDMPMPMPMSQYPFYGAQPPAMPQLPPMYMPSPYQMPQMTSQPPPQASYDSAMASIQSYMQTAQGSPMQKSAGYGQQMSYQDFLDKLPPIIVKIPAPIINVPAPIVNVPPAVVNVSVPPISVPQAIINVPQPRVNVPRSMINVPAPVFNIPAPVINVPNSIAITKEAVVDVVVERPTTPAPQSPVLSAPSPYMAPTRPSPPRQPRPPMEYRDSAAVLSSQYSNSQKSGNTFNMAEFASFMNNLESMKRNSQKNMMVDDRKKPQIIFEQDYERAGGNGDRMMFQDDGQSSPYERERERERERESEDDFEQERPQRASSTSRYPSDMLPDGIIFDEETVETPFYRKKQFSPPWASEDLMVYQDQTFVPSFADPDGQQESSKDDEPSKSEPTSHAGVTNRKPRRSFSIDVNIYRNPSQSEEEF